MRPATPRLAAAMLLMLLAGCTPGGTHRAGPAAAQPAPAGAGRLGAAGCLPASPATPWLQAGQKEVKIVWRMTGRGPVEITATHRDGTPARYTFGPQEHDWSNWNRPGQEWGTGFVLPKAGCWGFHLARTSGGSGDVWLVAR
jgi:hypothetical protein